MDPGKLKGIREWPTPTTVKLAKPLNDLLKKDQTFEWTDDCQKAFEELKK